MRLLVALILVATAAGCGLGGSACESAVREAAEISPMADTVSDLDEAIAQCASLADFEAAAAMYPDALDGVSASTFVANRCAAEPSIADSAICQELGS